VTKKKQKTKKNELIPKNKNDFIFVKQKKNECQTFEAIE